MSFTKIAPVGIGTEPGSSIRIGDSLLHSTGIDLGTETGIGVTIRQHGDATFTGIVTAASFSGSGVNLTGVASTDNIKTSTTANFTDGIQVGGATTLTGALTGTTGTFSGNVSIGGVLTYEDVTNVDSIGIITARSGIKIGPTAGVAGTFFADGSYVTAGIVTAASFRGSVKVPDSTNSSGATNNIHIGNSSDLQLYHNGTDSRIDNNTGGLQIRSNGGLNLEGATSGGNADFLKGYSTGDRRVELYNSDAVKLTTTSGGVEISGVATAVGGNPTEGSFISGNAVGVGTTTLAGRNAGVGTAPGTLIFNSTSGILQVYVNDLDAWQDVSSAGGYSFQASGGTKSTTSRSGYAVHTFTGPGTFNVLSNSVSGGEYLIVGGGAGGGKGGLGGNGFEVGGGGAGGHRSFSGQTFTPGSYTVVVGSGGPGGGTGNGGSSSVFGNTAAGGGTGAGNSYGNNQGRPGGSGGGGGHQATSGGSGNSPPTSPPQGNPGGNGAQSTGGGGGGASQGGSSGVYQSASGGQGGNGTSNSITGSSVTRAGGGGGGSMIPNYHTTGGSGGGGRGGSYQVTPHAGHPVGASGDPGTVNTGSGGGGAAFHQAPGGTGGSGIVIIAYPTS